MLIDEPKLNWRLFWPFALMGLCLALACQLARGQQPTRPVMIFFHSLERCPDCRAIKPTVAKLKAEGFEVRNCDVDAQQIPGTTMSGQQMVKYYNVPAIPFFVIVKPDKTISRLAVKLPDEGMLREFMSANELYPPVPPAPKLPMKKAPEPPGPSKPMKVPEVKTADLSPKPRRHFTFTANPTKTGFDFIEQMPVGWYWHRVQVSTGWTKWSPISVSVGFTGKLGFSSGFAGFPTKDWPNPVHEFIWIDAPGPSETE